MNLGTTSLFKILVAPISMHQYLDKLVCNLTLGNPADPSVFSANCLENYPRPGCQTIRQSIEKLLSAINHARPCGEYNPVVLEDS